MKQQTDLNLSDAFKELETIVSEFESGQLDLEKSMPKFKRGLELSQLLKSKLSQIENDIEEIKAEFTSPAPAAVPEPL